MSFVSLPRALFTVAVVGLLGAMTTGSETTGRLTPLRLLLMNFGYTTDTGIGAEKSLVCRELHTAKRSETLLGVTKEVSRTEGGIEGSTLECRLYATVSRFSISKVKVSFAVAGTTDDDG